MPRTRKPPEPPESYVVSIDPNMLEIVLERSLQSATKPLYEEMAEMRQEIGSLREQQRALVEGFEQMQRNHTEQLKMLAESLRQSLAEDMSE